MKDERALPSLPSFDDLKQLACNDPNGLSQLRRHYCNNFISSVPSDHQHRLLCIQNRVELELQRAKNPISGIIMLSGMMHQSVGKLADGFNQLREPSIDEEIDNKPTAEIISFQDYTDHQTY